MCGWLGYPCLLSSPFPGGLSRLPFLFYLPTHSPVSCFMITHPHPLSLMSRPKTSELWQIGVPLCLVIGWGAELSAAEVEGLSFFEGTLCISANFVQEAQSSNQSFPCVDMNKIKSPFFFCCCLVLSSLLCLIEISDQTNDGFFFELIQT